MTITIEVPAHIESRLRASAAQGDAETVRKLLLEAANPVVESLLKEPYPTLTDAEFEAVLDELDQLTMEATGCNPPVLSDYAVSREGIYEDHP